MSDGIEQDIVFTTKSDVRDDEDQEFIAQSKARHKRRLLARWKCKTRGHSHCFTTGDLCHVQLTDEKIDEWVNVMEAGFATVVDPPESVVAADLPLLGTDTHSVYSIASRNSISYKRPFVLFATQGLTDLRSLRESLADRTSSSPSHRLGPGHIPALLLTRLGEKIIELLTPLEIRRRLWSMGRLIKKMEKEQDLVRRSRWLRKKERAINRLVDDILELSSDGYASRFQAKSAAYANSIRSSLLSLGFDDRNKDSTFWTISLRVSPLDFLREDTSYPDNLAIKLREVLLQERIDVHDFSYMIAELIVCACNELHYGLSPTSRRHAFEFLHQTYFLPIGRNVLERLAQSSGPLDDLDRKLFGEPGGIEDHAEHACGVQFFVSYADDHPSWRRCVLGPNGLSLVPRLDALVVTSRDKDRDAIPWKALSWLCRAISSIVHSDWLVPALLERDVCNVLFRVMRFHQSHGRPENPIDYWIICITLDILHIEGDVGLRAVSDATSPEFEDHLRNLANPDIVWEPWMEKDVGSKVSEILEATAVQVAKTAVR